jgi:hypothetical protein
MLFQNFAIVSVPGRNRHGQRSPAVQNAVPTGSADHPELRQLHWYKLCNFFCIKLVSNMYLDDDSDQRQCVCSAQNARSIITDCANCVRQNDNDSDSDSDDTGTKTFSRYTISLY